MIRLWDVESKKMITIIRQNKFKIVGNCFQNQDFEQVYHLFHSHKN
jgi:hypothetical protein